MVISLLANPQTRSPYRRHTQLRGRAPKTAQTVRPLAMVAMGLAQPATDVADRHLWLEARGSRPRRWKSQLSFLNQPQSGQINIAQARTKECLWTDQLLTFRKERIGMLGSPGVLEPCGSTFFLKNITKTSSSKGTPKANRPFLGSPNIVETKTRHVFLQPVCLRLAYGQLGGEKRVHAWKLPLFLKPAGMPQLPYCMQKNPPRNN